MYHGIGVRHFVHIKGVLAMCVVVLPVIDCKTVEITAGRGRKFARAGSAGILRRPWAWGLTCRIVKIC